MLRAGLSLREQFLRYICSFSGRRGGGDGPFQLEALTAEHGPALRGFERHGGFDAALRTVRSGLGAGQVYASGTGPGTLRASRAFGFAGFTALGIVLEGFVEEENLFAGGEKELSPTLSADEHFI